MKILLRHLVLCALPILFGAGAGYGFTTIQGSCGAMVGALFAAKCVGRQREYLARFQLAGAGFGTVLAPPWVRGWNIAAVAPYNGQLLKYSGQLLKESHHEANRGGRGAVPARRPGAPRARFPGGRAR